MQNSQILKIKQETSKNRGALQQPFGALGRPLVRWGQLLCSRLKVLGEKIVVSLSLTKTIWFLVSICTP